MDVAKRGAYRQIGSSAGDEEDVQTRGIPVRARDEMVACETQRSREAGGDVRRPSPIYTDCFTSHIYWTYWGMAATRDATLAMQAEKGIRQ